MVVVRARVDVGALGFMGSPGPHGGGGGGGGVFSTLWGPPSPPTEGQCFPGLSLVPVVSAVFAMLKDRAAK